MRLKFYDFCGSLEALVCISVNFLGYPNSLNRTRVNFNQEIFEVMLFFLLFQNPIFLIKKFSLANFKISKKCAKATCLC
jgi:hypothetical protein